VAYTNAEGVQMRALKQRRTPWNNAERALQQRERLGTTPKAPCNNANALEQRERLGTTPNAPWNNANALEQRRRCLATTRTRLGTTPTPWNNAEGVR
jgi:hypothetical protein